MVLDVITIFSVSQEYSFNLFSRLDSSVSYIGDDNIS